MDDEISAREKAFKTVVQGQKSENLLDFDEPEANGDAGGSSLMGGLSNIPSRPAGNGAKAPASILTSSNPLDDLVSIFGSLPTTAPKPQQPAQEDLLGIF
jgi:hypothetical protein